VEALNVLAVGECGKQNMTRTANSKFDLTYTPSIKVEVITRQEAKAPVRIPPTDEDVSASMVRITPAVGKPWDAAFAIGFDSEHAYDGIFGWPDGASICVVAGGYSYVFKADSHGKNFSRLEPMPVTDVKLVPEQKLIVFSDYTHIFAFNSERAAWKTERLSWEGVTITKVGTSHIFGLAWDAMADKEVEFVVDVLDGSHTGGSQPWAKK